jgi:hypothetical protein
VKAAVSAIAEKNSAYESQGNNYTNQPSTSARQPSQSPAGAEASRKEASQSMDEESSAAVGGLRTIRKPRSTLSHMSSDEQESGSSTSQQKRPAHPATTPQLSRLTLNVYQSPRTSNDDVRRVDDQRFRQGREGQVSYNLAFPFNAQDATVRQASADDPRSGVSNVPNMTPSSRPSRTFFPTWTATSLSH